nr:MAG TPA: hypothetical protein [Caudoviricetes sp.]
MAVFSFPPLKPRALLQWKVKGKTRARKAR